MSEALDRLAAHEDPTVRAIHGVFVRDIQVEPFKSDVWDDLFARRADADPEFLPRHIVSLADEIKEIGSGKAPRYKMLAERHVFAAPSGERRRMTPHQFDLVVGTIALALTREGLGENVSRIIPEIPAIKDAVVHGVLPESERPSVAKVL